MNKNTFSYYVAFAVTFLYTLVIFIPTWVLGLVGTLFVEVSIKLTGFKRTQKRWNNPLRWLFSPFVAIGGAVNGLIYFANKPQEIVLEHYYIPGETIEADVDNHPRWFTFYCITVAVIQQSFDDSKGFFFKKVN